MKYAELYAQCERHGFVPPWVLEEFSIPSQGLLETRDQARKRQMVTLGWRMAERNAA